MSASTTQAFHERSFADRLGAMGDAAEVAFEDYCDRNSYPVYRLGFNRPPFSFAAFKKIPKPIRQFPDFCVEIAKTPYLVECKGFGRNPLKVKKETIGVLQFWILMGIEVLVFAWDSGKEEGYLVYAEELIKLSKDKEVKQFYNDKKEYVEFTRSEIKEMEQFA